MNGTELDAAIEQANRIFSRQYRPADGPKQNTEPPTFEPKETGWPSEGVDAERRFGQPHAKLFSFIGRKVRTPTGPGTLLQVFAERVTVLLDSELNRCAFFPPVEIEPVSWELP
jgi:hypothetical protein